MEQNNHFENSAAQETYTFNPMLWGVIGYLFLLIFRPFEYWEWLGAFHIQRVYMIGLLLGLALWNGKRYFNHSITFALLLFFFVMILASVFALDSGKAWNQVWEEFKLLVLYFVVILSIRNKEDFRILIIGFIVVTGIYIGKSLWEFFINDRHVYRMGIRRLIGIDQTYNDPNTFAATVIYSLPFAWALWKTNPGKKLKMGLMGYGVMSVSAIGLTGSRSGMLSFVFFLFLLWIRGKRKLVGVVAMVALIATSWFFLPDMYKTRFETLFDDSINETATESAQSRWQHFKWGIQLYLDRPIAGWGPGNAPVVVRKVLRQSEGLQLHNLTAQLLTETGTLGAIALIILLVVFYRTQSRTIWLSQHSYESTDFIVNISIASVNVMWLMLFQGLSGHNLYRYTWFWIAAVLALAEYFTIREHEKANSELSNGQETSGITQE